MSLYPCALSCLTGYYLILHTAGLFVVLAGGLLTVNAAYTMGPSLRQFDTYHYIIACDSITCFLLLHLTPKLRSLPYLWALWVL